MGYKKFIFVIICLISINKAIGQDIKISGNKKKSYITYDMVHPLHQWEGVSKDVNSIIIWNGAEEKISQVAVKVNLSSFDSRNANRDSHMIEVAEGLTFPEVTFASNKIEWKGEQLTAHGILKFHGVSRPTSFDFETKRSKDELEVSGSFRLKLTEFNITPPSLLGLDTKDDFGIAFKMFYSIEKNQN
jgi:polyisoprenoid-binding protein YceI